MSRVVWIRRNAIFADECIVLDSSTDDELENQHQPVDVKSEKDPNINQTG